MVVMRMRLGCWLQMWVNDFFLSVGLHQFLEDAMVLLVQLVGLPGLEVLLAVVELLEVSSLRVVVVSGRDRRGASFDLLHLLEMDLEGPLFHIDVCQLGASLRVEHRKGR